MKNKKNLLEVEFNDDVFFEIFPEWQGRNLKISQLSGGITNKLYRVKSELNLITVWI